MRVASRGVLTAVIVAIMLIGAAGPAIASDGPAVRGSDASTAQLSMQSDDGSTINVTQEFSLTPSTPGEVTVRLRFSIPSRIISLRTEVPADANVTATTGFERGSGESYEWDQRTSQPTLTYTLPVNESLNDSSPEGAPGEMVAVDAGEWALFQRPPTPVHWTNYASEDPIEFDRTSTTDGPGATGEWLVFLGDHETYQRTTSDQQFRLVVPSNANMSATPWTVLDSLTDASNALRVGDRDQEVFVVAAPTDDVQWGVRGLQTGESDLWVRDVEPVASPDNPWVHEYVHSRQDFQLESNMRWFGEASASYYAALLTYDQGRIRYDRFSERIGTGANGSYAEAVLANQSTWGTSPQYDKGALVAGQLDRRIRTASDRNRSLQSVVRAMNDEPGPVSLSTFLDVLGKHGDENVVETGARYAGTPSNVSMWNQTAHVMAFGDPPARFDFRLPAEGNNGSYAVRGPTRNGTVEETNGSVVVVPGEQLRVDALVENVGGRTGEYTASLAANGTVVDRAEGSLEPNETATVPLNHTFDAPGTVTVSLDGERRTVEVREPATARVTDVTATSREARVGGSAEVSARVENDADRPGAATVVFRRHDGLFVTKQVQVPPRSTTWVNASMLLSEPGTTTVSVGDAGSVQIAVHAPPDQPDGNGTSTTDAPELTTESTADPTTTEPADRPISSGRGPGFDSVTVVLAVALAGGLALFREWW